MLKRLILNLSVVLFVAGLAIPVHSAEVRKLNPAELQKAPKAVQTPQQIDTGHIARPKPDLQIMTMQIYPANPKKGDTVRFTAQIVNKGLASSTASEGGIRVGGETTPQTYPVPVLAPNAMHTITRYQLMSTAGNFRVTFIADANGSVAESKENNNSQFKDFRVKDILPDLTLVNPRVKPANPTVNDQIFLTATINNIGDIASGAFQTGVRIGGESQPKPAASVGHLDVTTPQSQQYVVARMWNTTRPGKYVVEFFVDTQDDVKEHNENNNSIKFTITVGP
jgi:subtilase family serine protease